MFSWMLQKLQKAECWRPRVCRTQGFRDYMEQREIPHPISFPGAFKGSWLRPPAWSFLDVSHHPPSPWTGAQD